ncbi:MAG: TIGR02281 family clan AA aspartic protease [Pararhodobacter sp.]
MFESLTPEEIRRLVYLGILGSVLIGYALVATRGRVLTTVRHIILWALLFVGVAAAANLWQSVRYAAMSVQTETGEGLVLTRGFDGQFHLTLQVTGPNGRPQDIRFIVDTGATEMVLRQQDAQKLGFDVASLPYLGVARTANGVTRTAEVRLDAVALEGHLARRVRALVNEGDLHAPLLGMGYLERFSRIEITRDRLTIVY